MNFEIKEKALRASIQLIRMSKKQALTKKSKKYWNEKLEERKLELKKLRKNKLL